MPSDTPASASPTIIDRVLRGSGFIALGILGGQGLRLAGNLVLTRLLFPEAFGLMALVSVFIVGMKMFSDIGLRPWIQKDEKGDDPLHLDTAWTLQVGRGVLLWLFACAMALPVASFFNEPLLASILPIAGLELVISGLMPTRVATAHRHLRVGQLTMFQVTAQAIGLTLIILLAWQMQSVWALVYGSLANCLVLLLIMHFGLPGRSNRFRFDRHAATSIVSFGKWIFLSTICGFVVAQGDKIVLGKFLSAEALGLYTIGFFLASFPVLLTEKVARKVLIPLYREQPPGASPENFAKVRKLRFGVTSGMFALLTILGFFGPLITDILYDPRYAASGMILVLVACAQMPLAIGLTYDQAALASGNSRQFFGVVAIKAILMLSLSLLGISYFGMVGAIAGQGAAYLLTLPAIIWLARAHGVWDRLHDTVFLAAMVLLGGAALWLHRVGILTLLEQGATG
ncbi:oligosaccharide flippase family protein [Roseovarius sp. C7]|uniref:oligosaccharide flippase family protein n=1 Tax=Roseovarius sp. C7 TaxID=3398643 RepID=UPI0039F739F6